MKLTDEDRATIAYLVDTFDLLDSDAQVIYVRCFRAGMERAAKICDARQSWSDAAAIRREMEE